MFLKFEFEYLCEFESINENLVILSLLTTLQTIGIDSEFCLVESLVTGIVDMWPEKLR
jgi:hypothetical protein